MVQVVGVLPNIDNRDDIGVGRVIILMLVNRSDRQPLIERTNHQGTPTRTLYSHAVTDQQLLEPIE